MIASMTGYGRGETKRDGKETLVEIRSLNNRFLDISIRLPQKLAAFEDELRGIIRKHLSRGRINISISSREINNEVDHVNLDLAQTYVRQLKALQTKLNIKGDIQLDHLLSFTDIFSIDSNELAESVVLDDVRNATQKAIQNLKKMRNSEGRELSRDLKERIKILDRNIKEIEKLSRQRMKKEYDKLRERIASLGVSDIDEGRLEMEISMLASRIDVTEECIRFKSHNKLFLDYLKSDEPVGRKLNFLLQEMTREANTIGSKAYDADISHLVVNIKEEVEKLREQVQNIE